MRAGLQEPRGYNRAVRAALETLEWEVGKQKNKAYIHAGDQSDRDSRSELSMDVHD
jgi:hypothetical protein